MKKLFFLLTCSLLSVAMMASVTVRGVVISTEDGLPVIGASVLEKGTSNGTITDFDGMYELTVQDDATLVVSYVGLATQELKVTGPQMDVRLSADAIAMEEVVVTAMGVVQEKKRLNFAVQNIGGDALTENKSANFVNSLQGKIAGVSVTNAGGSPNSGSQIIIRGISSVNNTPYNPNNGISKFFNPKEVAMVCPKRSPANKYLISSGFFFDLPRARVNASF